MTARTRVPRVLLITDESHPRGLAAPVLDALATDLDLRGLVHVQLRAKTASARSLLMDGRRLAERIRAVGAKLLVNRRIDVAIALGADGVHLPESGVSADAVRELLPGAIVSRACHDAHGLARAAREHADYAVLSPVFGVPGKGAPLGVAGFAALARGAGLPVVALGGITRDSASQLIHSGANGIGVIRHVLGAEHPPTALRRLLESVGESLR